VDLNLGKKVLKCHIWGITLCGAGIWTLWKVDQKYLESFECGVRERWKRSVGPIA
jgi:hypothetical protein